MTYRLLHNITDGINHPNYNSFDEVWNCTDTLTFDGIYKNVLENFRAVGYSSELNRNTPIFFVMGDYVGKDNTFDLPNVPKLEKYCNWFEVGWLVGKVGGELGWHTWSHPDLTTLTKEEIIKEITPPFPMKYFAYPYGKYNELVKQCVKEVGYEKAFSVFQTDGDDFSIPRPYLNK